MNMRYGRLFAITRTQVHLVIFVFIALANLCAQDPQEVSQSSARYSLAVNLRQLVYVGNFAFEPAPIVTVSGRVLDANGKPASTAVVTLIPRNAGASGTEAVQRTLQTDGRGEFVIRGVLPGSYLLLANLKNGSKEYWSEQRIDVDGTDITGLQMQLSGGLNLAGKVSTTSGGGSFDFQSLQIRLSPQDGNSSEVGTQVAADGSFSLQDVRRTTQRLQLTGLPDGWYLHSASFGQLDLLANGLKLGGGDVEHSLAITVSTGVGKVRGLVLEPEFSDPVPRAVVELFPDPANPYRTDLFRSAVTDREGHFVISNVVPGKYRLLAVQGRGDNEFNLEDYMTAERAGIRVVVGAKQTKGVELELFEAHR